MSLSHFQVTDDFVVSCFYRKLGSTSSGPWFAVREWDQKVIRKAAPREKLTDKQARSINRSSEQAIRASIRQVVLHMGLHAEAATREEVRLLKAHNVIGKRAPSCSLLSGPDMARLLFAFGKEEAADQLRHALRKNNANEETPVSPISSSNGFDSPVVTHKSHRRKTVASDDWEDNIDSKFGASEDGSVTASSVPSPFNDDTSSRSSPIHYSPSHFVARPRQGSVSSSGSGSSRPAKRARIMRREDGLSGLDALLVAVETVDAAPDSATTPSESQAATPVPVLPPAPTVSTHHSATSSEIVRPPHIFSTSVPALYYPPLGLAPSLLSSPLSRALMGIPSWTSPAVISRPATQAVPLHNTSLSPSTPILARAHGSPVLYANPQLLSSN